MLLHVSSSLGAMVTGPPPPVSWALLPETCTLNCNHALNISQKRQGLRRTVDGVEFARAGTCYGP